MILLLDAGNSRVKWAFHGNQGQVNHGSVDNSDINSLFLTWQGYSRPDVIVGSNVAGEGVRTRLETQLSRWRLHPRWITSIESQCGVKNNYERPAQLGSDRWASLIAARQRIKGNCLVVTVGSALTADVLSKDGVFVGGIIIPGVDLMHRALAANTSALKITTGEFEPFPVNTANALYSGSIQALAGTIERMHALMLHSGYDAPTCLISGGAAPKVQPYLTIESTLVENLVLEGLLIIAQS
jgi:type III pantothenate kinase